MDREKIEIKDILEILINTYNDNFRIVGLTPKSNYFKMAYALYNAGYRKVGTCKTENIFEEAWKQVQEYFGNNKDANSRRWETWEILNKMYNILQKVENRIEIVEDEDG